MGPFQAIGRAFRKYATGAGRARRSEFWWMYFFTQIAAFVTFFVISLSTVLLATTVLGNDREGDGTYSADELSVPTMILGFTLAAIALVALAIPVYATWVRRLHDMGQPGWWLLLTIIGFGIVPLIMAFLPSQPRANEYGPVPDGVYPPAPQWDPHQQYPGQHYSGVAQAQSPYPAPPVQAPPAQPQAQYPQPPAPPQH